MDICMSRITRWLETVFSLFGNPQELVSDNGPQFMSVDFANFLWKHRVQHIRSAVYNPTENGLVKVFNQVLKYSVQCFAHD